MPGTSAGTAKRVRCPECGAFLHSGPCGKPGPKPRPTQELIERGRVIEENGCHSLRGSRAKYPEVGDHVRIARFLLGLEKGNPLEARHTCDNAWCINPDHLVAGTSQDNHDDMVERQRSNRGEKHWNYKHGQRLHVPPFTT